MSTVDGWELIDPQPSAVVSGVVYDWTDMETVIFDSGVFTQFMDTENGWELVGILPSLGAHADQVWGPIGWVDTAHASSHGDGGTDEIAVDASQITTGTVAQARLGTGTGGTCSKFLADDQTWRRAAVSYTHLRAHETPEQLVFRLLLEKKKT